MSSQQKAPFFFCLFLWADAAYKWMKLRKEIPQRLNSQINNSIKQTIFLFGFRAAVSARTQAPFNNCICRWIYSAVEWKDMMIWLLFFQAKTKPNKMKQDGFKNGHRRPLRGKSRPELHLIL